MGELAPDAPVAADRNSPGRAMAVREPWRRRADVFRNLASRRDRGGFLVIRHAVIRPNGAGRPRTIERDMPDLVLEFIRRGPRR